MHPPSPCTGSATMAAVSSGGAMGFKSVSSMCFTHSTEHPPVAGRTGTGSRTGTAPRRSRSLRSRESRL